MDLSTCLHSDDVLHWNNKIWSKSSKTSQSLEFMPFIHCYTQKFLKYNLWIMFPLCPPRVHYDFGLCNMTCLFFRCIMTLVCVTSCLCCVPWVQWREPIQRMVSPPLWWECWETWTSPNLWMRTSLSSCPSLMTCSLAWPSTRLDTQRWRELLKDRWGSNSDYFKKLAIILILSLIWFL